MTTTTDDLAPQPDLTPWEHLRQYTAARIALGRTGTSLPTAELLRFSQAHAVARDAVLAGADFSDLQAAQHPAEHPAGHLNVRSRAAHRAEYLRRPDLGRRLHPESAERLSASRTDPPPDVLVVISDGLCAAAPQLHAGAVLDVLLPGLQALNLTVAPLVFAVQARVALADEAALLLGATLVIHLIGERPGLSSPDSLGAYLTYAPALGTLDAARNCVSNIRREGLNPAVAARRLLFLTAQAMKRQLSGVNLKDEGPPTGRALD